MTGVIYKLDAQTPSFSKICPGSASAGPACGQLYEQLSRKGNHRASGRFALDDLAKPEPTASLLNSFRQHMLEAHQLSQIAKVLRGS